MTPKRIFILSVSLLTLNSSVYCQWVQSEGLTGGSVIDIAIIDTTIFISSIDGNGIYKKGIHQNKWENSFSYQIYGLKATDSAVFFPGNGEIYRSFDIGESWEAINLPYWVDVYSIDVLDNNLFVTSASYDSVYYSDDYGVSFNNITPVDFSINSGFIWAHNGCIYIVDDYNPKKIFESSDYGVSWDTIPLATLQCNYEKITYVIKFNDLIWAGFYGEEGGVYIFNGICWEKENMGLPEKSFIGEFAILNDTLFCIANFHCYCYVNDSWVDFNKGLPENATYKVTANQGIFYCGHGAGPFQKLPGENWEPIFYDLNFLDIYSLERAGDTIYACTSSGLYMSSDFGLSFNRMSLDSLSKVHQIIVTDSLYYLRGQYDGFMISYDRGLTWNFKNSGLPAGPFYKMGMNTENIYMAAKQGLFRCKHTEFEWEVVTDTLLKGSMGSLIVNGPSILLQGNEVYLSEDNASSFSVVYDSVYNLNFIENNYYAFQLNWESQTFYLHSSANGFEWEKMQIEQQGETIDVRESSILIGGIINFLYDNYLSMSNDNGLSWFDVLGDLPDNPGYSMINYVKFYDQRTFANPTNSSLWYRDDLLTNLSNYETRSQEIFIHPNPSSSLITINLSGTPSEVTYLSIYNLSGQELIYDQLEDLKTSINISCLPSGIYIAKAWNDKYVKVQKFIRE